MADPRALQRLLAWLSPAFPVGSFAWSGGLETAIVEGRVSDSADSRNWIEGNLRAGGMRNDTILVAQAWRAADDANQLAELADLCLALIAARERHDEAVLTGEAFVAAARAWPSDVFARLPSPCPYSIAIGAIAAAHGIGLDETLIAFLSATVQAQVSVAVRLVPIGQTAGLSIIAGLEPVVADVAREAAHAGLADLGGIAYATDIAQQRHETLGTRIFRS